MIEDALGHALSELGLLHGQLGKVARRGARLAAVIGDVVHVQVRGGLRIEAARRYIAAYEQVTGKTFVPNTEEPIARIRKNLGITEK